MFFVIIYSAIDQGYIGLSLASCHKDEIWDLRAELGLIWDHFRALVPIGTKSQIWDLITSTEFAKQKKLRELNRQYLKGKRTVKFAFPGDSLGINKYPCSKGIEPPGLLDQECFFV